MPDLYDICLLVVLTAFYHSHLCLATAGLEGQYEIFSGKGWALDSLKGASSTHRNAFAFAFTILTYFPPLASTIYCSIYNTTESPDQLHLCIITFCRGMPMQSKLVCQCMTMDASVTEFSH